MVPGMYIIIIGEAPLISQLNSRRTCCVNSFGQQGWGMTLGWCLGDAEVRLRVPPDHKKAGCTGLSSAKAKKACGFIESRGV